MPGWTRWVYIVLIGVSVIFLIFPETTTPWLNVIAGVLYVSALISLVIAQIYRYRRVSSPLQRQQTKWVVYSLTMTVLLVVGVSALLQLLDAENFVVDVVLEETNIDAVRPREFRQIVELFELLAEILGALEFLRLRLVRIIAEVIVEPMIAQAGGVFRAHLEQSFDVILRQFLEAIVFRRGEQVPFG